MRLYPAGRINRLFGTGGGVMLSLYPDFPEDFDPAETPLLVRIDALEVPLWCARFERRGISGAFAVFADIDTERRAQEFLGLEFSIPEAEAGSGDEFCLEDLIGFAVEAEEFGGDAAGRDPNAAGRDGGSERFAAGPAVCNAAGAAASGDPACGSAPRIRRGVLADYYDSEANPLFGLEIDGREVLVPAVEEFIAHIDFEERRIRMVLPAGLLDL